MRSPRPFAGRASITLFSSSVLPKDPAALVSTPTYIPSKSSSGPSRSPFIRARGFRRRRRRYLSFPRSVRRVVIHRAVASPRECPMRMWVRPSCDLSVLGEHNTGEGRGRKRNDALEHPRPGVLSKIIGKHTRRVSPRSSGLMSGIRVKVILRYHSARAIFRRYILTMEGRGAEGHRHRYKVEKLIASRSRCRFIRGYSEVSGGGH